mgnify:CR=1 FL=1
MPDRETLERNLTSAMKGLPFKPGLFQPFLDAAGKARAQEPVDIQTVPWDGAGAQTRLAAVHA